MRERSITWGYLVFQMKDGEPQFLGMYQTQKKAEEDRDLGAELTPGDWRAVPVPFIGWGHVAPGVFSQNGQPPLKVVDD